MLTIALPFGHSQNSGRQCMTRYTHLRVGVAVVGSTSDVCGSEFGLAPP